MRLVELDPHWTCDTLGRHGQGISFECPVHRDHRLAVMFSNPVDGLPACGESKYLWQRTGETWDDLTLGPSIDASANMVCNKGTIQTPCWHGLIKSGEVT